MKKKGVLFSSNLFSQLSAASQSKLAKRVSIRKMNKDETLFQKGDSAEALYAVVEGSLRIEVGAPDGRLSIFNTLHAGDVFGEIALIDGGLRTADAVAETDLTLACLPRSEFLEFLRTEPDASIDVMIALCALLRRLSSSSEDTAFLDIAGRLARRLSQLSNAEGDDLCISQEQLATHIGASRVSVNQKLQQWKQSGFVELSRGRVHILDHNALEEVIQTSLGRHRDFL